MTREQCIILAGEDEELLFVDGYDDAIIGVCERFGQETIIAYNFNIKGAWMGDRTPCFLMLGDM